MHHMITFEVYGENFYPTKVNFEFSEIISPGDIQNKGRYKGQKSPYGSARYILPKEILEKNPFQYLAETFEPLLDELVLNGAEEWYIDIGRIYFSQCNEQLNYDELMDVVKLKCNINYSAYSVDTKEEENEGFDSVLT